MVLSSNQVQYNLLYRTPERNGVLEVCQELGITCVMLTARHHCCVLQYILAACRLVAYSPLCQGLLTGKYTSDVKPDGPRGLIFGDGRIREVQPLLATMKVRNTMSMPHHR